MTHHDARRFLTIPQVADEHATSEAQITALVRRGALPAIKLGGGGQWRIERAKLEMFIERAYEDTARRALQQPGQGDRQVQERRVIDDAGHESDDAPG